MKIPHIYAEWVQILERLKDKTDDQEVLQAMKSGTLSWQDGVADRFAQRFLDVVNFRMNKATDNFQKALKHGTNSESVMVQALLSLRKEMMFLADVIDLPILPDQDRKQYVAVVRAQADKMQKSLEESAKGDRSGKLSSIVRNHRINNF